MNTHQYDYFFTLLAEGSVSQAAEKLYISQPALSKYIRNIEEKIGSPLFYRGSRPLRLTEAGRLYRKYLEDSQITEQRFINEIQGLRDGISGSVTMAATDWRYTTILPILAPRLKKRYPEIKLTLQQGSHSHMLLMLEHDEADFALMQGMNEPSRFDNTPLGNENICLYLNRKNPVLRSLRNIPGPGEAGYLSTEEILSLSGLEFIMPDPTQLLFTESASYLDSIGFKRKEFFRTRSSFLIEHMVLSGDYAGFCTIPSIGIKKMYPEFCYFMIGDPPLSWTLSITRKKSHPVTPQMQKVMDLIIEMSNETIPRQLGKML